MKNLAWLHVLAGIWLIIAPFVLGYSDQTTTLWNDIILGIIVGIFALVIVLGKKQPTA